MKYTYLIIICFVSLMLNSQSYSVAKKESKKDKTLNKMDKYSFIEAITLNRNDGSSEYKIFYRCELDGIVFYYGNILENQISTLSSDIDEIMKDQNNLKLNNQYQILLCKRSDANRILSSLGYSTTVVESKVSSTFDYLYIVIYDRELNAINLLNSRSKKLKGIMNYGSYIDFEETYFSEYYSLLFDKIVNH